MTPRLTAAVSTAANDIEAMLDQLLPTGDGLEQRVWAAMRYSALGGGKRLRPFLVIESARMFSVAGAAALRVAAALEMVHCYSLVHDDLPAMDDDDLRRGRPTTHKAFDDATAILAGDGLLTRAFEVLSHPATHGDPAVRAELVLSLAKAAGADGMVGGQMIDLEAEKRDQPLDLGGITRLQRMKTGALIAYGLEAGAILGKAPAQARHALLGYAHDLGLAFQIADDILDVESTPEELGKATQKDEGRNKATFVSLLGLDRAKSQASILADQAIRHLDMFGAEADLLRDVARWVVERKS